MWFTSWNGSYILFTNFEGVNQKLGGNRMSQHSSYHSILMEIINKSVKLMAIHSLNDFFQMCRNGFVTYEQWNRQMWHFIGNSDWDGYKDEYNKSFWHLFIVYN